MRADGTKHMRRGLIAVLGVVAMTATLLVAYSPASPAAEAADARGFNAGHIVSDANFYNPNAMTAAEVQAFLNARGASCSVNCLKSYVTTTVAKAAQPQWCNGYQGGLSQTAAQIIDGVARSCGISQKALIVLLQKEQGLVTINNPDARRYRAAMGQGCPDTADCDTAYYGFFNQVYGAAQQFKIYKANPDRWWYKAGQVNSILYHPNSDCGRTSVYIQNQATAGLYIYTPYTPNAAALNAQWSTGDGCSSYGNRNFYMYWSEWFGDPLIASPEADIAMVRATYPSLGSAVGALQCGLVGGGCRQTYQNGAIFWTSTYGAKKVDGGIWGLYQGSGQQTGYLGYPIDTATWMNTGGGGWVQNFQLGAVYWSTVAGGRIVSSSIFAEYVAQGNYAGGLGWPMTDQQCGIGNGCQQVFQAGVIYWSAQGGTRTVGGGIKETFDALGGVTSFLGYPMGPQQYRSENGGGWVQGFQGGAIYWRAGWGTTISGGIREEYARHGYSYGTLGWPTSAQACGSGPAGCRQNFQYGSILWSPTNGAWRVDGGIGEVYAAAGAEAGTLGYPIAAATVRTGNGTGWVQGFQGGAIYWNAQTGGFTMWGGIREEYARQNYNWGSLGWPTSAQSCGLDAGGCLQRFQGGDIYWSPSTGTAQVTGAMKAVYDAAGAQSGSLGYPSSAALERVGNGTGLVQAFQRGAIYSRAGSGTFVLSGPIRDEYGRQGYNWGSLGWPISAAQCGLTASGCKQQFETGWIVWSPQTSAVRIDGGLWETWTRMGAEGGQLGYPISAAVIRAGGGWTQEFQHGRLSWTADRQGFQE